MNKRLLTKKRLKTAYFILIIKKYNMYFKNTSFSQSQNSLFKQNIQKIFKEKNFIPKLLLQNDIIYLIPLFILSSSHKVLIKNSFGFKFPPFLYLSILYCVIN